MSFRDMARRLVLSLNGSTGSSTYVLELVGDHMLKDMDIPSGARPYEEGAYSVIYDNRRGNIVVFSLDENTRRVAEAVEGDLEAVLPKIFDIQVWNRGEGPEWIEQKSGSPVDKLFGIEMEKLRLLSRDEELVWEAWRFELVGATPEELAEIELEDIEKKLSAPNIGNTVDKLLRDRGETLEDQDLPALSRIQASMVEAMMDLSVRAHGLGVSHYDAHSGNVAWDKAGKLKFIDLEDVGLDDAGLAPQSVR